MSGRMKMYPMRAGNKNVGIAAKRSDNELAAPNEDANNGAVSRAVRMVLGAAKARIGRSASFMVNLLVLCELVSFKVSMYMPSAVLDGALSPLGC